MKCKECEVLICQTEEATYMGRCRECDTIRNQFAAAALTGMCADLSGRVVSSGNLNINLLAVEAFKYADAMMEARKGGS